jgi:four helix bundle protein
MDKSDLEKRTKTFALRVIQLVSILPKNKVADVLGYQVLKSGTAVGANYREANRGESRRNFIHKIGIVEKEASETQYWSELLEESDIGSASERQWLLRESGELIAIFTTVVKQPKIISANRDSRWIRHFRPLGLRRKAGNSATIL